VQQVPSDGRVRRRPPAVVTAPSYAAATRSAPMHIHKRVNIHHQHIGIREHAAQHMTAAAGAWVR
jgi:hypothetical protein